MQTPWWDPLRIEIEWWHHYSFLAKSVKSVSYLQNTCKFNEVTNCHHSWRSITGACQNVIPCLNPEFRFARRVYNPQAIISPIISRHLVLSSFLNDSLCIRKRRRSWIMLIGKFLRKFGELGQNFIKTQQSIPELQKNPSKAVYSPLYLSFKLHKGLVKGYFWCQFQVYAVSRYIFV